MWNDLTMSERAGVIKMAVKAGLRDMKSIRDFYDNSLKYADGGSINISPSKRGTFTAAATKHGMGVQEFASKVLANKDNYSPAMVKKANFAKNASKWKHDLGGYLFEEGGPKATYGKPYYSYDKNMQIETDNGKPILNYSATLPEVNIIPDSKKSPADRNEARRFREKVFSDNAEREARDYTQRQIMKSQRDWDNSLEKKVLGYAQDALTGVGIGADIVSGLPIYSSLKGSRILSEANSLPEYVEGGLWLAPIGGVVGKEVYNVGKNALNTSKNTSKNTIKNTIGDIGKNSKTTPVDFNNLTLEQWTPEQWTAAQDAAIARGDMAEAQRLRDLHFQVSAPNTKTNVPLWTSSEEAFNSFDLSHFGETDSGFFGYGHYLTPMEKYAATYHPVNRRFYVNMENPYIGSNDQYFNRIQYVKDRLAKRKENIMRNLRDGKLTNFSKKLGINENTPLEEAEHLVDKYIKDETVRWNNKYVKYADEFEGKDGVLSWRELQGTSNKQEGIYKEVVVPNGEQIKSADAVTYDNNGVRIPLGLRDNFRSKDIRYGLIPLSIGGTALGNQYAGGGQLPKYLERPEEYSLRPFTIVSKTQKKEIKGNWEVEKNVLLPEVVVTGKAPYKELEVQDIKNNKYIKEQYEKDVLQALKGKSKSEVEAIQKQLADSGAFDLNADNLSEKEIKNIQRKIGAKEDGVWGKESANKWRKYNIDGIVGNRTLDAIGKFNNKQNWGRDVPTENTEWCAEWVYNKVMDATGQNYGVYGDAWKMPKNIVDNGGTEIYNIYDSSFNKVKDVNSLKKKTKEAISKNPFDVRTLQVGDVVGIYMPSSNMHETAMKEGSTFNTHIGIVTGFNSKGIPIIEHNIHRKHHKDLATNITGSLEGKPQITTVTRPAYEEMHTPFSTDSIESKYTNKSDAQPFKDFANSVAGSKELLSKVFSNIDAEEVERITLAVQGRETGFMKNRSSDQKGISGVKESAKKFYRDSIAKKDPMTVSSNLAKTKLSSFTAQERNLLNIHKPSDLEDPKLAGRAAAYLIAKNYDYFVRLKNKYPNLGITMDDVRYLTELSYNQGMRKLKNIGFKDGVKALEELGAIRKMADANAKVKDISATNYSHLGLLGKFIYDTFGEGHTPYISAAEKYRQKLIETKEKNN